MRSCARTGASKTSLHWRLDVVMNEDQDRTRMDNGPHNLAVLRHMAINVMQKDTIQRLPARKVQTRRLGRRLSLPAYWRYFEMRLPWGTSRAGGRVASSTCLAVTPPSNNDLAAKSAIRRMELLADQRLEQTIPVHLPSSGRTSHGRRSALLVCNYRSSQLWSTMDRITIFRMGAASRARANGSLPRTFGASLVSALSHANPASAEYSGRCRYFLHSFRNFSAKDSLTKSHSRLASNWGLTWESFVESMGLHRIERVGRRNDRANSSGNRMCG